MTLDTENFNLRVSSNGTRTVRISYEATIPSPLFKLVGLQTFTIEDVRSAENGLRPSIDFYLLLDTSPSMAFPTTEEGLKILADCNTSRGTCACHSTSDTSGRRRDGTIGDLYSVALSYNLAVGSDEEAKAVRHLAFMATSAEGADDALYRIHISEFNINENFRTRLPLTDDFSLVDSAVKHLVSPLFYSDSCVTESCPSQDLGWMNRATASSDAMRKINRIISDPGSGQVNNSS